MNSVLTARAVLDAMPKFEQRAHLKSLGFVLSDISFEEVETCVKKNQWDQGHEISANKDIHMREAFDASHGFIMPILLRMIRDDKE